MTTPDIPTARKVLPVLAHGFRRSFFGFWAILVLIFLGAGAGVATFGSVHESLWAEAGLVPGYFILVVGILIPPAMLPMFVKNGMTRHQFLIGASIFGLAIAFISASFMLIGFGIENAIYQHYDWPQLNDGELVFTSFSDVPVLFAKHFLIFATYYFGGSLLGSAFYRYGTRQGMLALPISVALITAVEIFVSIGGLGSFVVQVLGIGSPSLAVILIASCALAALTWWLSYRYALGISIRT